jgi:hypothetical protein
MVQALTPADIVKSREFCEMQLKMEEDGFVERPIFSNDHSIRVTM